MGDDEFLALCRAGDPVSVESAIAEGANVNAKTMRGYTALILAVMNGHEHTAEILIQHGANVDAETVAHDTVFIRAMFRGHTETAEILLRHGADINAHGYNGMTALMSVRSEATPKRQNSS